MIPIYQQTIKERRDRWSEGIPSLLSKYNFYKQSACTNKRHYSFNKALDHASYMSYELGIITLDIYFCLHCFSYHIGNNRLKKKEYCVWCGAWIKSGKLEGHLIRCK